MSPLEPLRLSFSRVDSYQLCPLQYRYRYVDKLPQQPSHHLSWGRSIHEAIARWWSAKAADAPPVELLLEALYELWDHDGFAAMDRDEAVGWYRHAQRVLRAHHSRYAATWQPAVGVETWFELPMPDEVTLVGAIDCAVSTSGGLGVVDWKTNRKAKTRAQVADSLQLAIYALAAEHLWGGPVAWVALDFVVPGQRVAVSADDLDLPAARRTVAETARRIRAGEFPAQPQRLCDWCDFRAICPAWQGEGPDVPGAAVVELARLERNLRRDGQRADELRRIVHDFQRGAG